MKAYIHTSNGRPWNEECAVAQRGFEMLGVECVPFSDSETLDSSLRGDIVVGGLFVSEHALAARGVRPPIIDYPDELTSFLGRRVWECDVKDIREEHLPLFVKPVREKSFPGSVVKCLSELERYSAGGESCSVYCSEPVEFVAEFRLFLRHGVLVDMRRYVGPKGIIPDSNVVNKIVYAYEDAPAGCAVDVGVTADGRTLLVEVNDGYALGCYGAEPIGYALLLAARWAELVGVEDELDNLNFLGQREEATEAPRNLLLRKKLKEIFGPVSYLPESALRAAEWLGAEDELMAFLNKDAQWRSDVWSWFAEKQGGRIEHAPDGQTYAFPSLSQRVCLVVDVEADDAVGSSSVALYSSDSAALTCWIEPSGLSDTMREWLYDRLIQYAERDACSCGAKSAFVLMGGKEGDYPDRAFYEARGYSEAPAKNEEWLARALGAYVSHEYVMEKSLA